MTSDLWPTLIHSCIHYSWLWIHWALKWRLKKLGRQLWTQQFGEQSDFFDSKEPKLFDPCFIAILTAYMVLGTQRSVSKHVAFWAQTSRHRHHLASAILPADQLNGILVAVHDELVETIAKRLSSEGTWNQQCDVKLLTVSSMSCRSTLRKWPKYCKHRYSSRCLTIALSSL